MGHLCSRLAILGASCPEVHPDEPELWCTNCVAGWNAWLADREQAAAWHEQFEGTAEPNESEPPCPLTFEAAQAWRDWLSNLGDLPAWSFEQVNRPSAN